MLVAAQVGITILLPELVWAETDGEGRLFSVRRRTDSSVALLKGLVDGSNVDTCSMALEYQAKHGRQGDTNQEQQTAAAIRATVKPLFSYLRKCNKQYSADPAIRLASVMDDSKGHTFAKEMVALGRTKMVKMMGKRMHRGDEVIEDALERESYVGPLLFLQRSSLGRALYTALEILARSDTPMSKQSGDGTWHCILSSCQVLFDFCCLQFLFCPVGNAFPEHLVKKFKALNETHRRNVLLADLIMAACVDSHLVFPSEVQMVLLRACVKAIAQRLRKSKVTGVRSKHELRAYINDELNWEQDYAADLGAEAAEASHESGSAVYAYRCR
jgi:hypothetical protein